MEENSILTTPAQIDAIIADQYNNWQGSVFAGMRRYHSELRALLGDYSYLEFLKTAKLLNPKPVYKLPEIS